MNIETKGWGSSTVSTKYIYECIHDILDMDTDCDTHFALSRLLDELAQNYKVDTGKLIKEEL